MKREAHKATKDLDLSRAMELSTATYGDQRAYINSVDPIHSARDVKEEWPLLFHKPMFYAHVKTLLGKDMLVSNLPSIIFTHDLQKQLFNSK